MTTYNTVTLKDSTLNINLPFLNTKSILENIDSLIRYYEKSDSLVITDINRKELLFNALNSLQNSNIPYNTSQVVLEYNNQELMDKLIHSKMVDREDIEGDKHVFQIDSQREISDLIHKSFKMLDAIFPDFSYIFNTLIGTIFSFKVKGIGGGSVSNLLGMIWLNPLKKWTVVDIGEQIYHEFIHNAFFLDDMIHRIFPDPNLCTLPDAQVISAIRQEKRPLDRSYHATCVAIGLMHYYHTLKDEKKALQFLGPVKETLSELKTKQQYIGERGIIILEEMIKFSETLDYNSIDESLSLRL